jgi:hypothetical protein
MYILPILCFEKNPSSPSMAYAPATLLASTAESMKFKNFHATQKLLSQE